MKKVLVIDDDQDILFMLKVFLKRNGYDAAVSLSCEEGLKTFYSFKPDIVLLDINVGSSDGRVVCQQIKASAAHQHIPVILISANTEGLKSYAAYGANAAVEKPFDLIHLRTMIEETV